MGIVIVDHYPAGGEPVVLTQTFLVNGVATDPANATIQILDVTNVTTAYSYEAGVGPVTRTGTGVYSYSYSPALAGRVQWRWLTNSTGGAAVSTGQLIVDAWPAMT